MAKKPTDGARSTRTGDWRAERAGREDRRASSRRAWARRGCPARCCCRSRARRCSSACSSGCAHAEQLDEIVVATTRLAADDADRGAVRGAGRALRLRAPDRSARSPPAGGARGRRRRGGEDPLRLPAHRSGGRSIGWSASSARTPTGYDFVSNLHPPTWPDGNDVEVMPPRRARDRLARGDAAARARAHDAVLLGSARALPLGNVAWETGLDSR